MYGLVLEVRNVIASNNTLKVQISEGNNTNFDRNINEKILVPIWTHIGVHCTVHFNTLNNNSS